MQPIEQVQREFFRALLLPLRGSSRKVTELATSSEGHAEEFFEIADAIIKPGMHLSSAERLELYHRQYWFRILDSLAEDFPLLRRMCGEPVFWDLIEAYLLSRPSRSFTLRHLGEGFAEFLDSSPLLNDQQQLWFGSIARMEYAYMESFEALQSAVPEPDDLQAGVIELQHHVRLLRLPVPADFCREWPDFSAAADCEIQEVWIAVWRELSGRSLQVRVDPAEAVILQKLQTGIKLAVLFDELPDPQPSAGDITRWFAAWQSHGWLGVQGIQGKDELDASIGWQGLDRMSSQAVRME
jgi:hypothetical protein